MNEIMRTAVGEILLILVAYATFALALEIGYRLGRRHRPADDEPERSHAMSLYGAVLGLLALMLGFTFAMAVSRYETRKTLMVDQANAIGTAALRARLLPTPHADQALALLRDYTESRLQYNAAGHDDVALLAAEARAGDLENKLWDIAHTVITDDPRSQPASLYAQALNDVIDLREKRRFALGDRVPSAVSFLLYSVAITAMGLVSYSCGLSGRRRAPANLTFAFLIALVMVIILDVDSPRAGFVRVSQESLIRLQQSLVPTAP